MHTTVAPSSDGGAKPHLLRQIVPAPFVLVLKSPRLFPAMIRILAPVLACLLAQVSAQTSAPSFEPVPAKDQPLYRLDFTRFYADEAARKADLSELDRILIKITGLKPRIAQDGAVLASALDLNEQAGRIVDRLQSFGGLRRAVNTDDATAQVEAQEGEDAGTKLETDTTFITISLQALSQDVLDKMLAETAGLRRYAHFIANSRRRKPHTAAEDVEATLNRLATRLDPFRAEFYTLMGTRSPEAKLIVDGRELNLMNGTDYAQALRHKDAQLREQAFRQRLTAYRTQGDVYAFALFEKARTANTVAEFRRFDDATDASLFDHHLDAKTVDAVLKRFRDRADLALRFQSAEQRYQQKILGLPAASPWDMEARPAAMAEPAFTILEASQAVSEALLPLGADYQAELLALFDPRNGRMDIVRGPHREAGDFTWGFGGVQVFYMNGYNGYASDVVTLAHEAAHVVHHRLIHQNNVPWFYSDGARYFSEGCAKINELLILDQLAKSAKNEADRVFYLRASASKLASIKFTAMYWAALATNFEIEVYRRVKAGTLKTPAEIHDVWGEFGRLWSSEFTAFPDLKYTWADTHHFFDASRYYSNYLFAWVLSLAVYERIQADPGFADKFVGLMRVGFSDEPATLLKSHLGIDLADAAALDRMFMTIDDKVTRFEKAVAR